MRVLCNFLTWWGCWGGVGRGGDAPLGKLVARGGYWRWKPRWILPCCVGGSQGGHRKKGNLGPRPEQAGLAGHIPGPGKAFLPGWPAFKPRQRGAFSLASLFCCPRALLSAWQKLIPLCSWETLSRSAGACLRGAAFLLALAPAL